MCRSLFSAIFVILLKTAVAQDDLQNSSSLYNSNRGKEIILNLYNDKLESLNYNNFCKTVESHNISTNVVIAGDTALPKVVLLHGINSGSSIALHPLKGLIGHYSIYAIDIPGQPTLSEEKRLSFRDDKYVDWLNGVLEELNINGVPVIAFSYGGFLLQRLMVSYPEKVEQAIFIVPGGIVNGNVFKLATKVLFPMLKYRWTCKQEDLLNFMNAFYTEKTEFYIHHQKAILDHFKMDLRRPPMIKKKELKNNDTPVYVVGAENDIFFPGDKLIKKSREIFPNFKRGVILEGSKHVPHSDDYHTIQNYILTFLNADSNFKSEDPSGERSRSVE